MAKRKTVLLRGDIKIKIGNHLADSHIYINGKEIACTHLIIELGSSVVVPRVEMTIPLYEGKVDIINAKEATANLEELIEVKEK